LYIIDMKMKDFMSAKLYSDEHKPIDRMDIRNVNVEEGCSDRFNVSAEDLAFYDGVPIETISGMNENEFFFAACNYLESTEDCVIDCDYAKIDIWFPVED